MNRYKKFSDALETEAKAELNKPIQRKSVPETESNIAAIWKEQDDIRKRDEALDREYQAARERAKKLKIKVSQRKAIDTKDEVVSIVGERGYRFIRRSKKYTRTLPKKMQTRLSSFYLKRSKKQLVGLMAFSVLLLGVVLWQGPLTGEIDPTDSKVTEVDGANNDAPTFPLLYSAEKSQGSIGTIKRVSPPEAPQPTFAYIDYIDGIRIIVSQQEATETFKDEPATALEKISKDLQATSVIQVDENKIYHGLDEKLGVQSLVAYKNGRIVLIRADSKVSDDSWAGYYLSLK